jgi:transketolase
MRSSEYTTKQIETAATNIRKHILKIALDRGGCYLAQACSSAEILSSLYMGILDLNPSLGSMDALPFPGVPGPDNMDYPRGSLYHGEPQFDKDRFFISPAHYASVVYCALVECGRLSPSAIDKFNVDGWNMEMIGAEHSPGFECTAGSLGQTISIACGTAHARKLKGETGKVYVLLSDGEVQEGQVWEAMQAAYFYHLNNLVVYVDVNGQQVEDMGALDERFRSFGATVVSVDGHNVEQLIAASKLPHAGGPLVVLCKTCGAHGIPLLERRLPYMHFVRIGADEADAFRDFYCTMGEQEDR